MLEAPTLAVTNNADGTATATLAGGDPAAVNTLYHARWRGLLGALPWTIGGSRTGPGSIGPIAVTPAYYHWKVESDLDDSLATSNLVYRNVSLATEALHQRIHAAATEQITGLDLAGIGTQVYEELRARDPDAGFPRVITTIEGETEQVLGGTLLKDDIGYPVRVIFEDLGETELPANKAKYLLWRETIVSLFIQQHLAGVSEVKFCNILPLPIFELSQRNLYQHMVGGLVLLFVCRRGRGV